MVTSAMPRLRRDAEPLKMTSAISPPRRLLALCSPRTQRTASTIFDFPDPFGPTMPVTPGANSNVVLSANDLKPTSSRRLSMNGHPRRSPAAFGVSPRPEGERDRAPLRVAAKQCYFILLLLQIG